MKLRADEKHNSRYNQTVTKTEKSCEMFENAIVVLLVICTIIRLPDDVTVGGAYDRVGAFPVGLKGHMTCCSGR